MCNSSHVFFSSKLIIIYCKYFSGSTETSAGLQKILQEIQPRDTNDFFSNARELESSETEHKHLKPQANSNGTNLSGFYHCISVKMNLDLELFVHVYAVYLKMMKRPIESPLRWCWCVAGGP